MSWARIAMTGDDASDDPFGWLEEVEGERALAWVRERNAESLAVLEGDPRYQAILADATALYTADDRIPYGRYRAGAVYNFWQDDRHVRGILRRASLTSYRTAAPDWETVLDFDALGKAEGESWVYNGLRSLPPDHERAMISLSPGGSDAAVEREFDLREKRFVADGFMLPEGKQTVVWLDRDAVLARTGHGGGTLNTSGYPRQIRLWRRGEPIEDARLIFEGEPDDAFTGAVVSRRPEGTERFVIRARDFFHHQIFHLDPDGMLTELALPDDVEFAGMFHGRGLVLLRSDWRLGRRTLKAGALVAFDLAKTLARGAPVDAVAVFTPDERSAIEAVMPARDRIYLQVLSAVKGRAIAARLDGSDWRLSDVELPRDGSVVMFDADPFSDVAFALCEGHLRPPTYYQLGEDHAPEPVKALPQRIDPEPFAVEQRFATSPDGTEIPYFLLMRRDAKADGDTPTLLYGYGGFEVSLTPSYVTAFSKAWLERGGAYAIANIRGGGEFGPRWHQAALKRQRQRAYDDFIAVAEDLIASGVSRPRRLGIQGGSNGGLLVGVAMTQRPELFNAVSCHVPLLDMRRYHKLLAGASWMGEYGDPDDPGDWAAIRRYSPYHNLAPGNTYPEAFFATSTKDDRVHPGHARKMVARLRELGHPVLYFEHIEGGHSAAADVLQMARRDALATIYLLRKLADSE